MEFVDDKGEVATAGRRHHHHRSLPPPPSPSLPSPIARYHHHNHHLSHPQSLFTTTIASQIRLHHRHARHNHHCSLLCLSLYVSGGAYRTKRDDSAKTMSQRLQADHQIPVPESLINTIGQTHKFSVKVSDHNLTEKTETITITKIPSPVVLPAGTASVENHVALTSEADGDHASERNKSTCHSE
ncbi:hypothetical protein YC2023_039543 [Brassica napus]